LYLSITGVWNNKYDPPAILLLILYKQLIMTTLDDQASEFEAQFLKEALTFRKPVPLKTGYCLNCRESTDFTYCCPECREDYEKRAVFSKGVNQA
jgi:hypothetical protein